MKNIFHNITDELVIKVHISKRKINLFIATYYQTDAGRFYHISIRALGCLLTVNLFNEKFSYSPHAYIHHQSSSSYIHACIGYVQLRK